MLLAVDQELDPIYHMRVIQGLLLYLLMPYAKEKPFDSMVRANPVLIEALKLIKTNREAGAEESKPQSMLKDV